MIKFRDWSPTQMDPKGNGPDEIQDWWVVPVIRTRDSGSREESNFAAAALRILGREQESRVEVRRFDHWACGWFEIMLAHPDLEDKVREIEELLECDPVLDSEDHSRRMEEDYLQSWETFGQKDFVSCLCRELWLDRGSRVEELLQDADSKLVREFYEELTTERCVEESGGITLFPARAAGRCTRERLAQFLREIRHAGRQPV